MRATVRKVAVLATMVVTLAVGGTRATAAGGESSPDEKARLAAAIADREVLGLPADADVVDAILDAGDVAEWGVPMTPGEARVVNLLGRADFAISAHGLIAVVEESPVFAGAFFDQRSHGELVILLTGPDPAVDEAIDRLTPSPSLGVEVRQADISLPELIAAMEASWTRWPLIAPDLPMLVAAVDVESNHIRIEVEGSASYALAEYATALSRDLGVPVTVTPRTRLGLAEIACSRTDCLSPMKAGVQVKHSTSGGWAICTQGFHVKLGSDKQFLTAGHCGWDGSAGWYHGSAYPGLYLGDELATLYAPSGKDAMRVQLPDNQASDDVYGVSSDINSARNPEEGEPIVASKGYTQGLDFGTVADAYASWTGANCGCLNFGSLAGAISGIPGDSGSPIIVDATGTSDTAVGILDTANGYFARLGDVLTGLGVSINN